MTSEKFPLISNSGYKWNVLPCVIYSLTACQLGILMGISQGYSAILLPQLYRIDSAIKVNNNEASWIASLGVICSPIGALIEGLLVDKYGRKTTMVITSFLYVLSFLLTYAADNVLELYISRIFLSVAMGMGICVGLYIAEISLPSERGTLLSLIVPADMLGLLLIYTLGYLLDWKAVALQLCFYSAFVSVTFLLIPESHIWHMLKKENTKAYRSLKRLRNGNLHRVNYELDHAEEQLKLIQEHKNLSDYFKSFSDPTIWKPFSILVFFSIFQQQIGYNVISFYAVDFFRNFGPSYNPNVLSIAIAGIYFLSSCVFICIVHKFDRKTLLTSSTISMAVFMALAAITFRSAPTVALICAFFYVFCCMMGAVNVPWMMIGEMFPSKARGTMSANVTVVIYVITFIVVKIYPTLIDIFGPQGVLWYFSVFCVATAVFTKVFFPETRGMCLFKVEQNFRK